MPDMGKGTLAPFRFEERKISALQYFIIERIPKLKALKTSR